MELERTGFILKHFKQSTWTPNKLVIEDGQLIYPEERFLIENHKLCSKAIMSFREWRANIEKTKKEITASDIPKEYTDLIVVLVHESDETLNNLVNRLNDLLSPFERNNEASPLFLRAIKQIIKVSAYQERYGLADNIILSQGAPAAVPKRLAFFRWQVHDKTILPFEILKIASKRREKRKMFSTVLTHTFQRLTVQERKDIFSDTTGNFILDLHQPRAKHSTIVEEGELFGENFFSSIKDDEYTTIAPYISIPRRRICRNFETILYLELHTGMATKREFVSGLSPNSRKKRGIRYRDEKPLDIMNLIWSEKKTHNEELVLRHLKLKLLQFHENVRPAYYGTFTKAFTNSAITGSKPFTKDTNVFSYEEDSEAEWDHDVDNDDIHTLGFTSDSDFYQLSSADEEEEEAAHAKESAKSAESQWVVPEGYLSEDEGIYVRRRRRRWTRHRLVSRPARWPIAGNKHFPMKPVIIGPSFETPKEPENHPLSDFKTQFLHTYSHMNPFDELLDDEEDIKENQALSICVEPTNELKPPLFQREVDKIVDSAKKELIQIIMDNKTKTMMGLVTLLKSNKNFSKYTTAQLQAMIHDIATQEIRGSNKEYNWYLRAAT